MNVELSDALVPIAAMATDMSVCVWRIVICNLVCLSGIYF